MERMAVQAQGAKAPQYLLQVPQQIFPSTNRGESPHSFRCSSFSEPYSFVPCGALLKFQPH